MKRPGLAEEGLLSQLEELTESLGIKMRYEKILKEGSFFSGGLCRIKGEDIIIINSKISIEDKIDILARALISIDLSQIFIKPALREFLTQYNPGRVEGQQDEEN
jgi:hypothetical protein